MTMEHGDLLYHHKRIYEQNMSHELGSALLIMPTAPIAPPAVEDVQDAERFAQLNKRELSYTMLSAFLNMPSVTLPGRARTATASLSISGLDHEDNRVLAAALSIEQLLASA